MTTLAWHYFLQRTWRELEEYYWNQCYSVFNLLQNRCSDWIRMTVQVEPEYACVPFAKRKNLSIYRCI